MKEDQKPIAETLFRCLSAREKIKGRDIRNPTKLSEIAAMCINKTQQNMIEQVKEVVEVFRKPEYCFITPPIGTELQDETFLDISHECLLRQWSKTNDEEEEVFAPLLKLPNDVIFPENFKKLIRYERQYLIFKGIMSEEDKTTLRRLSEDDTYTKAIDDLYQLSENKSKGWIEKEAEKAKTYLRLVDSAYQHKKRKRAVLEGVELDSFLLWEKDDNPNETWAKRYNEKYVDIDDNFELAMGFLRKSESAHMEFLRKSENARKKRWIFFVALSSLGFLLFCLGAYCYYFTFSKTRFLYTNDLDKICTQLFILGDTLAKTNVSNSVNLDNSEGTLAKTNVSNSVNLDNAQTLYDAALKLRENKNNKILAETKFKANYGMGNVLSRHNKYIEANKYYLSAIELGGYPDFAEGEFKGSLTIEKLYNAIVKNNYNVSIKTPDKPIDWLNEFLTVPDFYDILRKKKPDKDFSKTKDITDLAKETEDCRNKKFSELSNNEQKTIKTLNRLLLEVTYPGETPKWHKNPNISRTYILMGNNLSNTDVKDYDRAIKYYDNALAADPKNATAYVGIGYSLLAQRKYKVANVYFNKALEFEPENKSAYIGLGDLFSEQNNYDKALMNYNKALKLDPNNAMAYVGLGNSVLARGKYDDADEYYNKAFNLEAKNPDVIDLGNKLLQYHEETEKTKK